jgi:hypothetical protein
MCEHVGSPLQFDVSNGESLMKKLFYFLLTLTLGFLLAELLRRPKMQRLQSLEAKEARLKEYYARDEQEWQEELAAMSFEERMDWELFEAALKQSNYKPDWDDDAEDDYAVET